MFSRLYRTYRVLASNGEEVEVLRSEMTHYPLFWELATAAQAYMGFKKGNPLHELAREELIAALERVPWSEQPPLSKPPQATTSPSEGLDKGSKP